MDFTLLKLARRLLSRCRLLAVLIGCTGALLPGIARADYVGVHDPTSIDFGDQPVGTTSAVRTITITNVGDQPGSFDTIRIVGPEAVSFTVVAGGELPYHLAPGTSRTLSVVFHPIVPGTHTATLSMYVLPPPGAIYSIYPVTLTGNATPPPSSSLDLSTRSLTFDPTHPIYFTSPPRSVTATNTGNAPLKISSVTVAGPEASEFTITGGAGAGTLAPGASRTITLTFTPRNLGTRTGILTIASDAPGNPHEVLLLGEGLKPAFAGRWSPDSTVAFPDQAIGTTSGPRSVTLTNVGSGSASFRSMRFDGPGFTMVADTGEPSLAPGQSRTWTFVFTPTAAGPQRKWLDLYLLDDWHQVFVAYAAVTEGTGIGPAVSLDPGAFDFGERIVGSTSAAQNATLTNSGNAPLAIHSVSITGPDAGSFSLTAGSGSGSLAPGANRTLSVTFTPGRAGPLDAVLSVVSNAPESPHAVSLRGSGRVPLPAVTLNSTHLDFGARLVGTTSPAQSVTLTNSGDAPLSLSSISVSGASDADFSITGGGGSGSLAPGASRTITLTFTPSAPGARSASLIVTSDAPGSPHAVTLRGEGIAAVPAAGLTPASLTFAERPVGTTSPPQSATLASTGTAPLLVTSVQITGTDAGSFAVASGGGSSALAPGESRAISLTFTPTRAGDLAATLLVTTNAPGSPHQVLLNGRGIIPTPAVSLSTTTLNFGTVPVGTTSPPQSALLTNTGTAPLSVNSISLGGANPASFAITGGGGTGTLAPGASRAITLTFTPGSAGNHMAALSIISDAGGSPHNVTLVGIGGIPAIHVSPNPLAFGDQEIGVRSGDRAVTVTNTGSAPLVVSGVTLTGDPDFSINAGGSASLAPGATLTISLVFTPTVLGDRRATLTITHNAAGSPTVVTLTGRGVEPVRPGVPAAAVSPNRLALGSQALGGSSAAQPVTIASVGTAPLVIQSVALTGAHAGEFRITAGSPGTLVEGSSRAFSILFVPSAAGPRNAVLDIHTNAPGSPHRVALEGIGLVPATTAAPSGDWPVFGHDPRQLGLALGALDPQSLSPWSVPLAGRPGTSPVVQDGVAYVGTEGGVFAIDIATRSRRWHRPLPVPIRSAPAVAGSVVVVSAQGLYGLSVADGRLLWQRPDVLAAPDVSPMVAGDTVYLGGLAGGGGQSGVWAVRADTGANVWPAPMSLPTGWASRTTAAVYPELGLLFAGLGSPSTSLPPSGPAAVIALRLADGSPAWPHPVLLPAGPPPAGIAIGWIGSPPGTAPGAPALQPAVFLAAGDTVTALNAISGARLWSRTLPDLALVGPPVLSSALPQSATLYVAGASGKVYALTSTTGADAPGGLSVPEGAITGSLALAEQYLYVPTVTGLILAEAATGVTLWRSPLTAASGVAVAGGLPYVATADTRLVGFHLAPPPPPVTIHDIAIESLQVPVRVSRQSGATIEVTLVNRGTQAEEYSLLVRVQPGRVILLDRRGALAPGEKKVERLPWPPELMGDDGPKSLVAQLTLSGQEDAHPADNHALKVVTVGP